jgi:uncharacterized membrane protein (GlpM family)
MHILIKAVVSLIVILSATGVAKSFPSVGGLIAVMPLTGALVLIWVSLETGGNPEIMQVFTRSALWGILPSILFFLAALACVKKHYPLPVTLLVSFVAWGAAAVVHHVVIK